MTTDPPVVFQVGLDHDHLSWVAIIHFHTTADGRRWHGIARGPLDGHTVFKVDRGSTISNQPRRRRGTRRRHPAPPHPQPQPQLPTNRPAA